MARLYADENFPRKVVEELRQLGHDVLRAQEAGQANKKIPDPQVLDFAIGLGRAVMTLNRRHFTRLHKKKSHFGIIICTDDRNFVAFGRRIHQALIKEEPLDNKLIRINKPAKS